MPSLVHATLDGDVTSAEHAAGPVRHRDVQGRPAAVHRVHSRGRNDNPLSGQPTVAALAMLVDHVGGLVNHHRRGPSEWTVSSELSLEPDALAQIAAAPDDPVVATARPCGRKGPNALGLCEITHRDSVIATATVRSFYIQAPGHLAKWPTGPTGPLPPGSLAER